VRPIALPANSQDDPAPVRYVTRTRLAHAALLPRTTDASLAQIASRTGYGTAFSLGKAFRPEFGAAPGAYRGLRAEAPHLELEEVAT
jgi:transcriptional regulator GlxA family with amidase domain